MGILFFRKSLSLYTYTHVADEGGFEVSEYLNIQRWFRGNRSLSPRGETSGRNPQPFLPGECEWLRSEILRTFLIM